MAAPDKSHIVVTFVAEKPELTHKFLTFHDTFRALMVYDEFKKHLKEAQISVKTLAAVLGMNPTSIANYKGRGEVPRHLAVIATLLSAVSSNEKSATEVLSAYL